jgi:hypothetical protein
LAWRISSFAMWNQICALAGILLSHDPQELVVQGG